MKWLAFGLLTTTMLVAPLARAQDSISITSPAGGERWVVGSTQHIKWTTNLSDVALRYSSDNGSTWTKIEDTVDTSSDEWLDYAWTIPDSLSSECKIMVVGYNGEVPTESAVFSIVTAADDVENTGGCAAITTSGGLGAVLLLLGFVQRRRR